MAKALAYNRVGQQVVQVDTVNNRFDQLGGIVATAATTIAFPGRSENLIAEFLGESHFIYRDNAAAIQIAHLSGGAWTNETIATPFAAGGGQLTPTALQVDQTHLVAIVYRSNSGGTDGATLRTSLDGVNWTNLTDIAAATQPTPSQGGNSVVWRNTIFFAHAAGIAWVSPTNSTQATVFDTGSDSGLADPGTPLGHFAFWNGNLYFAKFTSIPALYQLTTAWDPTAPTPAPAWTRVATTGFPSVGLVASGPDTNTLLLFVNPAGNLCVAYSGQLGTKLLQATPASFPAFTDVTTTFLPAPYPTSADLGFGLFVDDRRRTNELQTIIIRDVSGNDTILANWDGATPFTFRTTFAGVQLMTSDERFGELRTYTALQPACFITAVTQPFPGRASISYTLRDTLSRPIDVFGEYTITGDEWLPMTEGDGDDGSTQLTSSPSGVAHTFFWDTFVDLSGNYPFMFMRVVARISGV